jgi:hypothetical protein
MRRGEAFFEKNSVSGLVAKKNPSTQANSHERRAELGWLG